MGFQNFWQPDFQYATLEHVGNQKKKKTMDVVG
jgi:hypothetical protein